jgi:hypothetical protein
MFKLMNPHEWHPLFNSHRPGTLGVGGAYASKAQVGNIQIKGIVQVEAGLQVQQLDLFVVKLKQDTCNSTLTDTGDLNNLFSLDTLPPNDPRFNGQYFAQTGNGTLEGRHMTFLNKKAFTVLGHRHFQVSNKAYTTAALADDAVAVTNVGDANKNFSFNIKNSFELEVPTTMATEVSKSWKTMDTSDISPTDQIVLLMFTNGIEGSTAFIDWNMAVDVKEAVR